MGASWNVRGSSRYFCSDSWMTPGRGCPVGAIQPRARDPSSTSLSPPKHPGGSCADGRQERRQHQPPSSTAINTPCTKSIFTTTTMTWISKSLTGLGLLFLAHAYVLYLRVIRFMLTRPKSCYSAQEHSALQSTASALHDTPATITTLPIDISIETIVALLITIFGLVLGTPELRPIRWRVWAGKIEREGEKGFLGADGETAKDFVGNPFKALESRPGFVDVRKQKRDFAEWIREGGALAAAESK